MVHPDLFRAVQVTVVDRKTDRVECLTTGAVMIVRRNVDGTSEVVERFER